MTITKVCTFEPCGEKVYRLDLCRGHHAQQNAGKELKVIRRYPRGHLCEVEGCTSGKDGGPGPHRALGMCSSCYTAHQRANRLGPYAYAAGREVTPRRVRMSLNRAKDEVGRAPHSRKPKPPPGMPATWLNPVKPDREPKAPIGTEFVDEIGYAPPLEDSFRRDDLAAATRTVQLMARVLDMPPDELLDACGLLGVAA